MKSASPPTPPTAPAAEPALTLIGDTGEMDRRRNLYLATVAHEMRNALAPLANAIDVLAIRAWNVDGITDILPMARRQIAQLTTLTDDLLDLGRAVNDEFHMHVAVESVQDMVGTTVIAWRLLAETRRQAITLEMPERELSVLVDRMRFGQVLQNVLGNAVKFTPDGGSIAVRVELVGAEVRICVTDSGIGIPAVELGNVFDLFYRVRGPGQGKDGFGIGLALAKRLIAKQGGRISVDSAGVGQGAAFTIALPLVIRAEAA